MYIISYCTLNTLVTWIIWIGIQLDQYAIIKRLKEGFMTSLNFGP